METEVAALQIDDVDIDNLIVQKGHGGRPDLYPAKILPNLEKIREWVKQGINDYAIAESLNLSARAYSEYKKRIELKSCYDYANAYLVHNVVNALYKKACGFHEINEKATKDGPVEVQEYYPPDTVAGIFYLKNRDPENWKDKVEVTSSVSINFQLPEAQARLRDTLSELDKLQALEVSEFEVIPDG